MRIYVNKIEIRVTFKVKTWYYLEPLAPETMQLLRSTECKINKDKSSENVPQLEINAVLLVHGNIANKIQESCRH